jgi:hypothetical protein
MATLTAPADSVPARNDTADPGPLRAAHTTNLPALLRQLGASLLVTTYQAGKLVMVRDEGDHRRRRWLLVAIMACGLLATGAFWFSRPKVSISAEPYAKLQAERTRTDVEAVPDTMPDFAAALGARKAPSTLLVLFIPSKDRWNQPIDQEYWVGEALQMLGKLFGGATAFPQGQGVWREDAQAGKLLFDEPVVIQCYTGAAVLEQQAPALRDFLHRLGREARQGAVGLIINRDYLEIGFPLDGPTLPARPQRTQRR